MNRLMGWFGAPAAILCVAAAVWGGGAAVADSEVQSSLVEDFAFPGADVILAEHGLKVFNGDGHIDFVPAEDGECAPGLINVETVYDVAPHERRFCFRTSGARGFLTMEVPNTFLVRAADKALKATAVYTEDGTVTGDEVREIYTVKAGKSTSIEAGHEEDTPVLVELRFGTW